MTMRDTILDTLICNAEQYVSGQQMCEQFGVTRAAIWKHIKALQQSGYEIEASPKKGYKLIGLPDALQPVLVLRGMHTQTIGQNIDYKQEMANTNARAKKLAEQGAPAGTVVLTEQQTQGRGRLGRTWFSPAGSGVWMSVLLRPEMNAGDAMKITMLTGLAVARAIETVSGIRAGIKWPNDIVIGQKKVCGILTEMNANVDGVEWVVVGIGVNVNMRAEDMPEELRKTATSLYMERGLETSRLEMVRNICYEMELLLDEYQRTGDFVPILNDYRSYSVTLGQTVRVTGAEGAFIGTAAEFDDEGVLLVQLEDGTVKRVLSGDVSVRGVMGYV
nr:biotin--[acetyl-CoA-carboxylase] ligase [Maliibacterium massiliense]